MNEKIQDSDIVLKDTDEFATELSEAQLPGFHDLKLMAEGTSGKVYSVRRDSDSKALAVKVYEKSLIPDANAVRRFEQEVSTLQRLSHPNIVKIYGYGTTESGQSYILMENVEGKNLRKLLNEQGAFEPNRAATAAREVCRALTAAHENGIIHRDLKPTNIILDERNIAKVVDFGIAKAVGSANDTITEYGAIIGTPAYMSPEQCLNQRTDERSDIYSLGCTLFELLTNEKAFEAETAITALAKQINKDRSHLKPTLDNHKIPTELQTIVLKCLDRDPESRYKTALELDHALSGYLLQVEQMPENNLQMSTSTQLILCVCALIAVLVIFETVLFHARETIEADPGHPMPTSNASLVLTGASALKTVEIKNRLTGSVIFSESAAGMNIKKAIQNAASKGVSLAYADLKNADLTQIVLNDVNLQSADLTNARLTQAKLSDDRFDGAILTKADLTQAHLQRCTFRDGKMSSANLVQIQAPFTDFRDADLTNANLVQANLTNCDLRNANLSEAKFSQARFTGSNIANAKMITNDRFNKPDIRGSTINGVTIR